MTNKYRIDSLLLAIEEALQVKPEQYLSRAERTMLAVEALEREVNNGGYEQFFENSSRHFANDIVEALEMIGCPKAASITLEALAPAGTNRNWKKPPVDFSEETKRKFEKCDDRFFKNDESLEDALFSFVAGHQEQIRIPYISEPHVR